MPLIKATGALPPSIDTTKSEEVKPVYTGRKASSDTMSKDEWAAKDSLASGYSKREPRTVSYWYDGGKLFGTCGQSC